VIRVLPAAVSMAMAALLAVAGYAGPTLLAAALVLVILGLAVGWAALLDLPHPAGTALTVAVTGGAALLVTRENLTAERPLGAVAGLMGFAVLAAFVHELLRRDGRERLVESVTGTLTGQVIAVIGSGWLLLPVTRLGDRGVLLTAVAVGVAGVVSALPWPLRFAAWAALAAGGAAAVAVSRSLVPVEPARGAAIGALVAGVTVALTRMLGAEPTMKRTWALFAAALAPVAAAGAVGYAAARLIVG